MAAAAPTPDDLAVVIASERGPGGAQLVAIDAHGDRQYGLLAMPRQLARDTNPTLSPDGAWIVFASSRDRPLDQTSLWIAPVGVEVTPVRLTSGASIESHPTWTRDGSAIVYASTRDGGDFDLWRQGITNGRAAGEPVQLTSGAQQEVTPTVARDGTVIYAAVSALPDNRIESHLEQRAPDGTITRLTDDVGDASPMLSPDDRPLAFARIGFGHEHVNNELWIMRRSDRSAQRVVELPITEESGPVWSQDGRYLFATSVLRGDPTARRTMWSSVIYIDLAERPRRARMLKDRAGGIVRLTPAILARTLDVAALRANPEYVPELARIMVKLIEDARDKGTP
ncbi:hypothetical protein BH11MYX3_BH11MYX3_05330 [soil metagenome]